MPNEKNESTFFLRDAIFDGKIHGQDRCQPPTLTESHHLVINLWFQDVSSTVSNVLLMVFSIVLFRFGFLPDPKWLPEKSPLSAGHPPGFPQFPQGTRDLGCSIQPWTSRLKGIAEDRGRRRRGWWVWYVWYVDELRMLMGFSESPGKRCQIYVDEAQTRWSSNLLKHIQQIVKFTHGTGPLIPHCVCVAIAIRPPVCGTWCRPCQKGVGGDMVCPRWHRCWWGQNVRHYSVWTYGISWRKAWCMFQVCWSPNPPRWIGIQICCCCWGASKTKH